MSDTTPVLETSIETTAASELWLDFLGLLYHTYYCAHSGHWNIKGASFAAWHTFLGDVYEFWYEQIDTVAEHIRASFPDTDLPTNLHVLLRRVQGDPTEGIELDGIGYFQAILVYQEAALSVLSALSELAEKDSDQASLDLATEITRGAKKLIWQTKSHLE